MSVANTFSAHSSSASGAASDQGALASRFGVFYGDTAPAADLMTFYTLVLDSERHPDLAPLTAAGKTVFGYVSIGEVSQTASHYDAARATGALVGENGTWGSWRTDLRNPAWRALLLDEVIPAVAAQGFNGLFLDTIDTAAFLEPTHPGMMDAAVQLVHDIRARFPDLKLMMNRGLELLPRVADDIDAVLGESIFTDHDFATGRNVVRSPEDYRWATDRIEAGRTVNPELDVFTLDYWNTADVDGVRAIYEWQLAQGYTPYVSDVSLARLDLPPDGIGVPSDDAANRVLTGSRRSDVLRGGSGDDQINAGDGNDAVLAGLGNDTVTGGGGADHLMGGAGNDHLRGDGGADALIGGAGADLLEGGTGYDTAWYHLSESGVTVSLASGTGLGGDAQGDRLAGIENVVGSAFDDALIGSSAVNRLEGGDGADRIIGGGGADNLTGGTGADAFVLLAMNDRNDTIADFQTGCDRIELNASVFGGLPVGALDAGRFAYDTAASAATRFIHDTATGTLFYDRDGAGSRAAVALASLGVGRSLVASDIVLIAV